MGIGRSVTVVPVVSSDVGGEARAHHRGRHRVRDPVKAHLRPKPAPLGPLRRVELVYLACFNFVLYQVLTFDEIRRLTRLFEMLLTAAIAAPRLHLVTIELYGIWTWAGAYYSNCSKSCEAQDALK